MHKLYCDLTDQVLKESACSLFVYCMYHPCRSLEELKGYGSGPACHLVEVMFGMTLPSPISPDFAHWLDSEVEPTTSVRY